MSRWNGDQGADIKLQANQVVDINCQQQELEYSSIRESLQMGQNSILQFTDCILRNFDFSEGTVATGAKLRVVDSMIGFGTTCVVRTLPSSAFVLLFQVKNSKASRAQVVSRYVESAVSLAAVYSVASHSGEMKACVSLKAAKPEYS